jgi:hypothetical protein
VSAPSPDRQRLRELQADAAIQGLGPREQAERDLLQQRFPDVDADGLDLAAAALDGALSGAAAEPLPPALRRTVEHDLHGLMETAGRKAPRKPGRARRWFRQTLPWSGWAAAAALLGVWLLRPAPRVLPHTEQCLRLAAAPGTVSLPGHHPAAPNGPDRGEVVWNTERQEGYLRLWDLPPNDPERFQYQLWIFDKRRDERYPVDGGVFDVPAGAVVVIPVRARLAIGEPVLFAITRERPGGVVVSDRQQIVLVASAKP